MQKQNYIIVDDKDPYWPDNTIYFYTDSAFLHYPYFKTDEQKQIVLDQIKKIKT